MILSDEDIYAALAFGVENPEPYSELLNDPIWEEVKDTARAIESAILAKLGSAALPEPMGYLCDWGNDSYGLPRQTVYYYEPGCAIEDDWNCHPKVHHNTKLFTAEQLAAAVLWERERICNAIKDADDRCVTEGDYMLDSNDCIAVARGEWVQPDYSVGAIRKGGAQ